MTNETGQKRKALLTLVVLAIAASLTISPGMAANADGPKNDKKGDSPLKDFDIKKFGFDREGNPYLEVYGKAGRTLPDPGLIAYAYVLVTDTGIYAADSHEAQHADDEEVANLAWHGHKVEIALGAGANGGDCLIEIGSFESHAMLERKRVTLEDTEATEIFAAQTIALELVSEHPDDVPEGECVAEVIDIFDTHPEDDEENNNGKLKEGNKKDD